MNSQSSTHSDSYNNPERHIISIKTRRYSVLVRRILETYNRDVEICIDTARYTDADVSNLLNWYCTNKAIGSTIDFTLRQNGAELFGFHDTPDELWAAISEREFVESLAKEKIIRYRILAVEDKLRQSSLMPRLFAFLSRRIESLSDRLMRNDNKTRPEA